MYAPRRAGTLPAMGILRYAVVGGLAGAAGSTALNAATWLDMAVRVPHLVYGAVTVAALRALDRP